MEFTLKNLISVLSEADYEIFSAGWDDTAAQLLRKPARFYVGVRARGEVLDVATALMKTVWSSFERGLMEFRVGRAGDFVEAVIAQSEECFR